jgi:phospholipid/cholesterol/gamma-HCH transport system substrate-binding protein
MTSTARLGAFILVALLAFGIMVFLLGNKQFLFSSTYHVNAPFDNVAGLDEGAPVRAGGVRIGTVRSIQLPNQPQDKITVELELASDTRNVIKKDSIATIETEGLLGNKYIAVSFGSADAEQVRSGDTIDSRPAVDYGDVAKKASDMLDSAREAVDSSKVAIGNINEATDDMKSITGKMNSGQGTMGALLNDRSLYRGLNATVAQAQAGATSFQENMEALKHNFFLRGFFKKRGYFDSSELNAHAIAKLPARAPMKKFTLDGSQLFDKPDQAKLGKEKSLNQIGAFLESNPFSLAVIEASTGAQGKKEDNLKLSQARAMIVRQYLAQKFKVDDARIKTRGVGEGQQAAGSTGTVTIVVYPPTPEAAREGNRGDRLAVVKNK